MSRPIAATALLLFACGSPVATPAAPRNIERTIQPLAATITLAMRQSLVLLPKVPMRPRLADERIGFFTVDRINYGLDEQKAASETFIRRWRLEPKDPAAYARGELVEPVKPIIYGSSGNRVGEFEGYS